MSRQRIGGAVNTVCGPSNGSTSASRSARSGRGSRAGAGRRGRPSRTGSRRLVAHEDQRRHPGRRPAPGRPAPRGRARGCTGRRRREPATSAARRPRGWARSRHRSTGRSSSRPPWDGSSSGRPRRSRCARCAVRPRPRGRSPRPPPEPRSAAGAHRRPACPWAATSRRTGAVDQCRLQRPVLGLPPDGAAGRLHHGRPVSQRAHPHPAGGRPGSSARRWGPLQLRRSTPSSAHPGPWPRRRWSGARAGPLVAHFSSSTSTMVQVVVHEVRAADPPLRVAGVVEGHDAGVLQETAHDGAHADGLGHAGDAGTQRRSRGSAAPPARRRVRRRTARR